MLHSEKDANSKNHDTIVISKPRGVESPMFCVSTSVETEDTLDKQFINIFPFNIVL